VNDAEHHCANECTRGAEHENVERIRQRHGVPPWFRHREHRIKVGTRKENSMLHCGKNVEILCHPSAQVLEITSGLFADSQVVKRRNIGFSIARFVFPHAANRLNETTKKPMISDRLSRHCPGFTA
jgi:hypothetical protein